MKSARRSLLFVPADSEKFVSKAEALSALDAVILDLEDGVAPAQKNTARAALKSAIPRLHAAGKEVLVRVNDVKTMRGIDDLLIASSLGADAIVLPMARERGVIAADWLLSAAGCSTSLRLVPMIETAAALREIDAILNASARIDALLFGAEDYTNDLLIEKKTALESLAYARAAIVSAARARDVDALDSPCTDFRHEDVYLAEIVQAKAFGFSGKATIHPVMTEALNGAFSPSAAEIEHAERLLAAFREGLLAHKGAVSFEGEMVDQPVALRAERILRRAGLH